MLYKTVIYVYQAVYPFSFFYIPVNDVVTTQYNCRLTAIATSCQFSRRKQYFLHFLFKEYRPCLHRCISSRRHVCEHQRLSSLCTHFKTFFCPPQNSLEFAVGPLFVGNSRKKQNKKSCYFSLNQPFEGPLLAPHLKHFKLC